MAAIKREDLEAGRFDLSDVVYPAAPPLPPVSPGQVLRTHGVHYDVVMSRAQ